LGKNWAYCSGKKRKISLLFFSRPDQASIDYCSKKRWSQSPKNKKGISNLSKILPDNDLHLSRLVIYTDGIEMIVTEKGKYFSATSMQRFFSFDTEKLETDVIHLAKELRRHPAIANASLC
jgi:hypothetical protein